MVSMPWWAFSDGVDFRPLVPVLKTENSSGGEKKNWAKTSGFEPTPALGSKISSMPPPPASGEPYINSQFSGILACPGGGGQCWAGDMAKVLGHHAPMCSQPSIFWTKSWPLKAARIIFQTVKENWRILDSQPPAASTKMDKNAHTPPLRVNPFSQRERGSGKVDWGSGCIPRFHTICKISKTMLFSEAKIGNQPKNHQLCFRAG